MTPVPIGDPGGRDELAHRLEIRVYGREYFQPHEQETGRDDIRRPGDCAFGRIAVGLPVAKFLMSGGRAPKRFGALARTECESTRTVTDHLFTSAQVGETGARVPRRLGLVGLRCEGLPKCWLRCPEIAASIPSGRGGTPPVS